MDMLLALKNKEEFFGYSGNGDFDFYSSTSPLLELKKKTNSSLVFTGLQIVKQEVVLKKRKNFFSIKELIIDSAKKRRLYGYIDKNSWFHIGTVKDLESFKVDYK
jgi:NDP-sugar pyrophosphorylase family protein